MLLFFSEVALFYRSAPYIANDGTQYQANYILTSPEIQKKEKRKIKPINERPLLIKILLNISIILELDNMPCEI